MANGRCGLSLCESTQEVRPFVSIGMAMDVERALGTAQMSVANSAHIFLYNSQGFAWSANGNPHDFQFGLRGVASLGVVCATWKRKTCLVPLGLMLVGWTRACLESGSFCIELECCLDGPLACNLGNSHQGSLRPSKVRNVLLDCFQGSGAKFKT